MKKYRFKIHTPWGKKGDVVPRDEDGFCSRFCTDILDDAEFERYNDLFEEVKEVSSEDKLAREIEIIFIHWNGREDLRKFSKRLIDAGLDPDKLEGQK